LGATVVDVARPVAGGRRHLARIMGPRPSTPAAWAAPRTSPTRCAAALARRNV
jgi:hypothetical protein